MYMLTKSNLWVIHVDFGGRGLGSQLPVTVCVCCCVQLSSLLGNSHTRTHTHTHTHTRAHTHTHCCEHFSMVWQVYYFNLYMYTDRTILALVVRGLWTAQRKAKTGKYLVRCEQVVIPPLTNSWICPRESFLASKFFFFVYSVFLLPVLQLLYTIHIFQNKL